MRNSTTYIVAALFVGAVTAVSCSTYRNVKRIEYLTDNGVSANIRMTDEATAPELEYRNPARDSVVYQDFEGRNVIVMKARRDENTGEMVAADVIDAAVVTARFRNVAERHGKVDLQFQIIVPREMQDSRWQIRFNPDLFILEDSIRLEPVLVTGAGYRRAQLRGYEQYERFLSKIISDTTYFIDLNQLELFLQRNLPEIYAFKSDSSFVSDDRFESIYGVTQRMAVDHYTNKFAWRHNEWRKRQRRKMYDRYVKAPIVTEGLRLDTIIHTFGGDFIYNYTQTIEARPRLRKADIVLSGDIYESNKRIYTIPRSEPLTFYISSVCAFADHSDHYMRKVISRRAEANSSYDIVFALGKADVNPSLGNNASELARVGDNLCDLLANEVYDLDSIVVTSWASPEGSYKYNDNLSRRRSESVSRYMDRCMKHLRDSIGHERGMEIGLDGEVVRRKEVRIPFIGRSCGENWGELTSLVAADTVMTQQQKDSYMELLQTKDPDAREASMRRLPWYGHMKDGLYPLLRSTEFRFHLHRRGMIQDTVVTTELDTTYMNGVRAIDDRDYKTAAILLAPYQDYNTAIAYIGLDRNLSAMEILSRERETPQVLYMKAIVSSRLGRTSDALRFYAEACRQEPSFVHRGNLDPEISVLIKEYGLNRQDDMSQDW